MSHNNFFQNSSAGRPAEEEEEEEEDKEDGGRVCGRVGWVVVVVVLLLCCVVTASAAVAFSRWKLQHSIRYWAAAELFVTVVGLFRSFIGRWSRNCSLLRRLFQRLCLFGTGWAGEEEGGKG